MSSAADPADAPSGTSATEFVLEEFDTTVPENAIDDLAECIAEIVRGLRAAVVSDERLESLLRGDPGPDILHGADLTEQGDPEPFTQRTIIEPLFDALGYPDFTTEASGLSEAQRKKADYIFSLREYDDIDSRRLPVEAEPLNKKLDQEAHGIGQVKEWLDTYSFEAEFALAVDGMRWTLIKYDRERYQYDILAEIDLQPVFVAAFENIVGQQASPAEWLDDSDAALLEDFVRSFGFENFCAIAGDARTVIKETKSEITDAFYDEYVRRVFGVIGESASEGDEDERTDFSLVGDGIIAPEAATGDDIRLFSVELMNRLIFIKFLEDKHVVDPELLRGLWETYEDGVYPDRFYSTFLTQLFYDVFDTKPTNRTRQVRSVDLFEDIPYLDGGLFRPRTAGWEGEGVEESAFDVRDSVLESIIGLLERYTFSADGGPRDLDPSVLGNVFEKTINYITTDPGDRNKELGAYYTPDEITRFCAERTVRPALFDRFKAVLKERGWPDAEIEGYEDVRALIEDLPPSEDLIHALLDATDSLRVVDPACGSGHFLTSTLEEIVSIRRALYTQIEAAPPGYRLKKATVLENIYGVDIVDPAVEIAKLRMWLSIIAELTEETAELLDTDELALPNIAFNVRQGNSLIGYTGFPEQTEAGEYTFERWSKESVRNRYEDIIEAKRKFRAATDRETASEYQQEAFDLLAADREDLHENILRDFERAGVEGLSESDVAAFDPFHWVLEFAEVYAEGGFDVVVGNPPWDVLTPNREDYFSRYDPLFRTRSQQEKNAKQEELLADADVAQGWEAYKQNMQMRADYFNSNISYELQAPKVAGKTVSNNQNDLSALFLERVFALANDDGYVAQVLPGTIYSGSNTKDLRLHLLDETELEAVVGFENHGIFPEIDNRYQFGVVAFENSGETDVLRGVFQQRDLDVLSSFREHTVEIPKRVLAEYSPEARIFPYVRHQREVDALDKILFHPPVGETINSSWTIDPYSELHRSKDSDLVVESRDEGDYPVYQGKNIYHHSHDSTVFDLDEVSLWGIEGSDPDRSAKRFIQAKGIRDLKRALYDAFGGDTTSQSQKRFVNQLLSDARGRELSTDDVLSDATDYRIVLREVARVTDERTSIAAVIPKNALAVHTLHTIRPYRLDPSRDDLSETPLHSVYERVFTDEELFVAVGLLNSLPFDFLMRTKVDSHIVMYKLEESQMPRLTAGDDFFEYIWTRAARLNCYGEAFAEMRDRLGGIDPATDEPERRKLQAQIDAAAFHAYGLDREETQFILDDFHRVQNPRLMTKDYFDLVSDHYDALAERDSP